MASHATSARTRDGTRTCTTLLPVADRDRLGAGAPQVGLVRAQVDRDLAVRAPHSRTLRRDARSRPARRSAGAPPRREGRPPLLRLAAFAARATVGAPAMAKNESDRATRPLVAHRPFLCPISPPVSHDSLMRRRLPLVLTAPQLGPGLRRRCGRWQWSRSRPFSRADGPTSGRRPPARRARRPRSSNAAALPPAPPRVPPLEGIDLTRIALGGRRSDRAGRRAPGGAPHARPRAPARRRSDHGGATTSPRPRWCSSTSRRASSSPMRATSSTASNARPLRRGDRPFGERLQDRHRRRPRRGRRPLARRRASATRAASRRSSPATSRTIRTATAGARRSPARWGTAPTPSSRKLALHDLKRAVARGDGQPPRLRRAGPLRRPGSAERARRSPPIRSATRERPPASGTPRSLRSRPCG